MTRDAEDRSFSATPAEARALKDAHVHAASLMLALRSAEDFGGDPEQLCQLAGMTLEHLTEPDRMISYAQALALWRVMLAQFPGEPLGLHMARVFSFTQGGLLAYAVSHSSSLGEAWDFAIEHGLLTDNASRIRKTQLGDNVVIDFEFHPRVAALAQPVEGTMAAMHLGCRMLTGQICQLRAVHLAHEACVDVDEYTEVFGVLPEFSSNGSRLIYPASTMTLPVIDADPQLSGYLKQHASDRLANAKRPRGLDRLVCDYIDTELVAGHTPRQVEAARRVGMSERQLQRSLARRGVGFRELLDNQRQLRAKEWLSEPDRSIEDVATALGYDELRSFHRACRRWHNLSPQQWRKQLRTKIDVQGGDR